MNIKSRLKKFTILVLFLFLNVVLSYSQQPKLAAPRQEKLLNGMNLLVWNDPNAAKVSVRLRIHSGSAFDPQNKEGTMAMLADVLFPSEAAKEFFTEELGGSLDVTSNYDYIQINAAATPEEFLTLMETLANAVINPQIDKDITAKIGAARLDKIKELEKNPSYIADQAAAKRLFGDFPYGRPQMGTSVSLAKIDFADLLFARQRFLAADNATLAVVGSVKPDLVYRAARRYFGAWIQADKQVPATFRQPDAPDTKEFLIEMPNAEKYSTRVATMVSARSDRDFYTTQILTRIWQNQFCYNDESKGGKSKFESNLLRGIYIVSVDNSYSDKTESLPPTSKNPCSLMLEKNGKPIYPTIMQNDFDTAKSQVSAEYQQKTQSILNLAEMWLDITTFKLVSVKDEMAKLNSVIFADVQRVAENMQKQPSVKVIVKKSESAKSN
jgi:predicted Zn-dependent peptidase